ncbi:MAG: CAP domain-containing protein [Methanobrevibacter sp.]|nr:CAP domain-containing protein [Methanobrevibacter sp.]
MIIVEEVNAASKTIEYQMLDLVNEERVKVGIAPLKMDTELFDAAKIRADELEILFDHTRPDGTSFKTVSPKTTSEICAGGTTPEEVMGRWMKSSGHSGNILNPNYKSIGVGFSKSNKHYYNWWVQLFGTSEADERPESVVTFKEDKLSDKVEDKQPSKKDSKIEKPSQLGSDIKKPKVPEFSLASTNKKILIKWKKVSNVSGYQIYRSTKKNKGYALKKTITKGSTIKFTDKNLKKKQKYYYRIRSYKINNGKRVYSSISKAKSKIAK